MSEKRVEAVIDTENIRKNYRYAKNLVGGTEIISVVKADAYGHGAVRVCRALENEGCRIFAVAAAEEGELLRKAGIESDILIMGITPVSRAAELSEYGFIQAVNCAEYATALSAGSGTVRVHIKVDTGMSRLGLYCHGDNDITEAAGSIAYINSLKGLKCEGIFTHFACSDNALSEMTKTQYRVFNALCDECESRGIDLGLKHCGNSGAIINFPGIKLDAVRAGIILYGYMPDGSMNPALYPAMRLTSTVSQTGRLKCGDTVSYGALYNANCDIDIAVISIGYADGFSRLLSGKANVLINGKKAGIIGRICMDMCMADITGIPCAPGDEVEIFGGGISVDELALKMGTINYELLCAVSGRVPRRYI
ncbi:MAG: alanine racemase [Eubacteriales bacterium]|nr:alanine racemase [Eubacteriales bacterium]